MIFLGERLGFENTGLSDIPVVMNSAEADDLSFLASEDCMPTKIQTTQGVDRLSGTTRKVAQYLKGKSSVTLISEDIWICLKVEGEKVTRVVWEGRWGSDGGWRLEKGHWRQSDRGEGVVTAVEKGRGGISSCQRTYGGGIGFKRRDQVVEEKYLAD
ncbi:hypothetical protein LOK49_LG02G01320 [Camellia lanceoleosa]|uniref:Uncharacterized protein n=1 Tax=Camellia lanceoleosa TaxID=1840588 RepID=A0ACC0IQL8_9ERIC|nr:hypothetical protein LOK49_LG02G01320 [Camellia lanceoleosa]